MANVLPLHFRKAPPFQVNYTWIETMSNTGYVRFYPCGATATGPAYTYFLTVRQVDSYLDKEPNNRDDDFDFTFKVPATVAAADCIVNLTQKGKAATSCIITVNIIHVDLAAAETVLGTFTCIDRNLTLNFRECMKIPLTQQHFKVGEKLRVNIVASGDADADKHYYHDPTSLLTVADSLGRTVGTDLTVDVPFKINV